MESNARPKRKTVRSQPTIIEISDSDEDILPTKKKRFDKDTSFTLSNYDNSLKTRKPRINNDNEKKPSKSKNTNSRDKKKNNVIKKEIQISQSQSSDDSAEVTEIDIKHISDNEVPKVIKRENTTSKNNNKNKDIKNDIQTSQPNLSSDDSNEITKIDIKYISDREVSNVVETKTNVIKEHWTTRYKKASQVSTAKKKSLQKNATDQCKNSIQTLQQNHSNDADEISDIDSKDISNKDEIIELSETETIDTMPQAKGRSSFWERRKVWNIHELLAETENIEPDAARNIVNLFNNDNTIPFICRYRRDLINQIGPERLRDIKNSYTEIIKLRKKAETIVTSMEKNKTIDNEIRTEMLSAKSVEELEFLYAPYKPVNKGSLAERAKSLGLEEYAHRLLYGIAPMIHLNQIVDYSKPQLNSIQQVETGIMHIISHIISKHTGVLEELRKLQKTQRIMLQCAKAKFSTKNENAKTENLPHHKMKTDERKYQDYFRYMCDVKNIKPHQVLAINRGEKQKFLTVKIIIPEHFRTEITRYIYKIFFDEGLKYDLRRRIFELSVEDCYSKKLQPLVSRQVRSDLNELAKKSSIEVFAKNLKQLLLMAPVKGERILGIDPGFTNGCKYAMISETADVLETGVIYPHDRKTSPEIWGKRLAKLLEKYNCKIIALGNGTACRETEFWISELFERGILDHSSVRYSIVSEQGASIYSCSDIAKKEFPQMDVNEISAVSIARRLIDPLSEYVKIEPRHIGVGMYQHDINEKALTDSLHEVASECVSFVGVDINTASYSVLKYIAGLGDKKAEKIIEYRTNNGPFKTREELQKVKLIGAKTFLNCAGFVRIEPRSVGGKVENLLDCTWVHPESYHIAKKIINNCKLNINDIGKPRFIDKIKEYANHGNLEEIANDFKIPVERLEMILVALQRELLQDYRQDLDKRPLFKQGITRMSDLSVGDVVTGAVTNITDFGAFVDIGVECDGLIHISKMKNMTLNIGDRVTASLVQIDVTRRRIGLRLEEMLIETDSSFTFANNYN